MPYQQNVTVRCQATDVLNNYPVDLGSGAWDTATLISDGKMQADGSDIHVYVDGVEVDYWLDGINTSMTKLWIVLDGNPAEILVIYGDSSLPSRAVEVAKRPAFDLHSSTNTSWDFNDLSNDAALGGL